MIKLLLRSLIVVGLLLSFSSPSIVTAQVPLDNVCGVDANSELCQERSRLPADRTDAFYGPSGILTRVAQFISLISGIAAVIMIILAGFRFITAGGDSSGINSARNAIIYSAIGLGVAATSQVIVVFVLNRL